MRLMHRILVFIPALLSPALAAASKAGMPQLDPTWIPSQIFWLTVTFGLLYLLVSRSIIPTVQNVLDTREAKRSGDLSRADALTQEATTAQASYEKAAAESRAKAQAMIAKVQAEAASSLAEEQAKLDASLKARIAQTDMDISLRLAKAQAEIPAAASALASEMVAKLLSGAAKPSPAPLATGRG